MIWKKRYFHTPSVRAIISNNGKALLEQDSHDESSIFEQENFFFFCQIMGKHFDFPNKKQL